LLAYKKAAKLTPAPSAVAASLKVHRFELDKSLVAEAAVCRELQWCHKTYKQAATLANVSPKRATTLYAKIVDRAPRSSRIHFEARRQIVKLAAN